MGAIIGHEGPLRELHALGMSAEPPHAILLTGAEGSGRTAVALEYLKTLNCEQREGGAAGGGMFGGELAAPVPCGVCRACRLIGEGSHPDVVVLGPGDALCKPRANESHEKHPNSRDIRICQVRGLIDLVSRYPYEARYRAVIIDPADRLGREAANTLLKTLEEPPGHTVLILVTAAPEAIIETIQSRCRRIDLRPVAREVIEAGLVAEGFDAKTAAEAAGASKGLPGLALTYARKPDLMEDRGRLLARCGRMAASRRVEQMQYAGDLAERWRRDRRLVAAEMEAWESFWEGRLRSAALDERREDAAEALAALKAVRQAMADLQAQVQARGALELMLLSFPRLTLAEHPAEEEVTADV